MIPCSWEIFEIRHIEMERMPCNVEGNNFGVLNLGRRHFLATNDNFIDNMAGRSDTRIGVNFFSTVAVKAKGERCSKQLAVQKIAKLKIQDLIKVGVM